jgi:peptidyl-prolyl cis-trans isomerase D
VTPEKRSAEVLVAQDEAAAQKLATAWKAGADWAAMQKTAQDAGATPVALEDATREQFPSADLAEAVFTAAPNEVTGPIKSAFGWQVLRVSKATPGSSRTLDQVKDELRTRVARDRAADLVDARYNKLEDALSAGGKLDDLPGDLGVAAVAGTLDAQGNTPQGEPAPIPGSPALRQAIVTAAFALQKDQPPRLTQGPDQSYYAIQLEDVIEPKLKPLAEVEAQVRDEYEHQQRRHAQEQVAARLLSATKAGGSLDDAATVAGLRMERTPPVGRNGATPGVAPQLTQALFKLKKGDTDMVETPDGFLVARLAEITDPDPAADPAGAAQMREALTQSLDRDVGAVFATTLRDRAQPRVNRTLMSTITE